MLRRAWPVPVCAVVIAAIVYAVWPLTPKRYYSGTTVTIAPERVPPGVIPPVGVSSIVRAMDVGRVVLSRTYLERLMTEFRLFEGLRNRVPMEAIFDRIRQNADIRVLPSTDAGDLPQIRVGFFHDDPRTCADVADRLLGAVLDATLTERVRVSDATDEFLRTQVDEARTRVIDKLKAVGVARSAGKADEAHVLALESQAQDEVYKALLVKVSDSRLRQALEVPALGEHFMMLDRARVPDRPLGPTRNGATAVGGTIGAVLGLLWMALRASKTS